MLTCVKNKCETERFTGFFFYTEEQFYNNNEAQIWQKIKSNVRTIQAGVWNHACKVCFSNILLSSSNSTVSSVEILQMLR